MLVFIITAILVAWYFWYDYGNRQAAMKRFKDQVGTYFLDIRKTDLGVYSKDSALYQKLGITFKADSTFSMNMRVPFVFDSAGRWEAGGGLEDWNWLYYKANGNIRTQFDQCCLPDSTFYLNSTTPQKGYDFIQEIFFRKIR